MTDKDGGISELDCTGAKHSVWLVKVPKYLATKWMNSAGGEPVGKLKIAKNLGRTQVTFSLDESLARDDASKPGSSVATEHKFSMQGMGNQSLAVFSQSPGPGGQEKRAIEGRVVQKVDCTPMGGKKYMQQKMMQIVSATKPTRTVQQLESAVKTTYKPVSIVKEMEANDKRKKEEGKRSRREREEVMAMLFKAFEKHQYYTINDLGKVTDQPISYLKEIMREIGNYNIKNPHKNMWELKPEYRHHEKQDSDDS